MTAKTGFSEASVAPTDMVDNMWRNKPMPWQNDFWSSTAKKSNASLASPGGFRIAH